MTNYWKIPKLFIGRTVFIIGGGPSVPDILKDRGIWDHPVVGVNDAFRLGSWVNVLYFGDARWYWWCYEDVQKWSGIKVTYNRIQKDAGVRSVAGQSGVLIVRPANGLGICTERYGLYFNGNSGAGAVNLAYYLGAKRIVLVGFDMREVDGETNWHPHYEKYRRPPGKPYTSFINSFRCIARDARKLRIEIVNATPGSKLPHFPFVDFEEEYARTN